MAINRNGQATKYKFLHNGRMLKKGFHNSTTLIWSAGSTVTYKVDTGVEYTEEVDSGATCLAPKTFTPTKDGWTFVGWRNTTTADKYVLTEKVMDSEPITLYAVFEKAVEAKFVSYNSTNPISGKAYYNNGYEGDFTGTVPSGADYPGWTFRGWSGSGHTNADATPLMAKGDKFNCGNTSHTFYGLYQKTVTQTFISYNKTEKVTGTAYYNAYGNVQNASITYPSGAAYSGWSWRGWSAHNATAADAAVEFGAGQVLKTLSDYTVYGLYKQSVTLTYYDNSSTAATKSGTRYYNAAGNNKNPSFVMNQAASSGWSARGWSTTNKGDASITYANGATITLTGNLTIYGLYQQTITVTYYDNSSTAKTTKGTRYWAPAGYINPSFTLPQASVSGWSARGWSTGTAGNSSITYNNNTAFTRDSNVTLYGCYSKSVTLSYNGNGATSGSTSSQSGTAYRNYAGTVIGASFTLRDNGFSRTNHAFTGWNLGAVGAQVTLNESTTAYAQWKETIITVYEASLNWNGNWIDAPTVSVSTNNTAYVNTATYAWAKAGGSDDDDYGNSGQKTILTLTDSASSQFAYADVTFTYLANADYGESEVYLDGEQINSGSSKTALTKNVTLTLSNKKSCTGQVVVEDNSSSTTMWSSGYIAPTKVVLHN